MHMKRILLLLSFLFVALCAVLLCRWRGYVYLTQPPEVREVFLCEALDENSNPVNAGDQFQWGTRSVCLLFSYGSFQPKTAVDIKWLYEGRILAEERVELLDEKNSCAFYLMKDDGAPLPIGNYAVVIESMGKSLSKKFFVVTR